MGTITAGYGEARITPRDNNHYLAGYIRRSQPMKGVHDDIYVRTLVIDGPWNPLAIVQLDLLCIDKQIYMDTRRTIEKILGKHHLIVAATHTHSAPSTIYRDPLHRIGSGCFRKEYYDQVITMIREALEKASESQTPVQAWITSTDIEGVATDRNTPGKQIDQKAVILGLDTGRGGILVINYAVHPSVLGPENLYVTRDLIGSLQDTVEALTGYKTLFLNGAAANISTRFTRRERSFSEAKRLGKHAADQIISAVGSGKRIRLSMEDVWVNTEKIELETRSRDEVLGRAVLVETSIKLKLRETQDPARRRVLEAQLEAISAIKEFSDMLGRMNRLEVLLTAINIDDVLGIVTWPGEIHSDASLALRGTTGYKEIMLVGYANEYTGYLVPEDRGEITYESLIQLLKPSMYEKAVKIMKNMLGLI